MSEPRSKVPVIVVTGFLGSGKTTLLNRVLARRATDATGTIGMIVNELGAIGIDGELLAGGPRQVELPGGCVCCVLGDELDRTVLELVAATPGLDAIVLETTGVAEPLPIAWAFGREPLSSAARLAVIVTLVDATGFIASRGLSPAVDEQVKHADVIVLTKGELVGEDERWAVLHQVRALAPEAPLVEGSTDQAAAWLDGLIRSASSSQLERDIENDLTHDHAHAHRQDEHGIDSVWVAIPDVLDLEELEDQLAALPGNYIRIKGIAFAVDGRVGVTAPRWVAFHRVGLRVSSELLAKAKPESGTSTGPSQGRAVALGPGVERGPLAACIEAAVLSSSDDGADR
jgi:G3E family GTPase